MISTADSSSGASLEQPLQLGFSRSSLRSVFGFIDATAQPERLVLARERIASIDQDGGRAPEPRSFSGLWGVDQLMRNLHVASIQPSKDGVDALIRQLPMGATVEVLDGDVHCFVACAIEPTTSVTRITLLDALVS